MSTAPQTYRRKQLDVQAMQYTAETCEALHTLMGWPHTHSGSCATIEGDIPAWIEFPEFDAEAQLGDWVVVDSGSGVARILTNPEFHSQYEPVAPPIDIQPVQNGTLTLENGWVVRHIDGAVLVRRSDSDPWMLLGDSRWAVHRTDELERFCAGRITDAEHALLERIAEAYEVSHD